MRIRQDVFSECDIIGTIARGCQGLAFATITGLHRKYVAGTVGGERWQVHPEWSSKLVAMMI